MARSRKPGNATQGATPDPTPSPGAKRGPGRPRRQIDADQVRKLAALGCTLREIANFCECGLSTIQRNFEHAYKTGIAELHISIRRAQVMLAIKGKNPAMLIWMGRNHLHQRQNPPDPMQTDPLVALTNEYRRRYELLAREKSNGDARDIPPATPTGGES